MPRLGRSFRYVLAGCALAALRGGAEAKEPPPPIVVSAGGDAVLRGRVLDAAGAAVAGAEVRAYRTIDLVREGAELASSADPALPDGVGKATSGADGTFQVGGLATGVYVVRVAAPPRGLGVFAGVVAAPGGGPAPDLALSAGLSAEGDVVDGTGKGVAGVAVAARFVVDDAAHPEHPVTSRVTTRTDEQGRFRLEGLPERVGGDAVTNFLFTARAEKGALTALRITPAPPKGPVRLVLGGRATLEGTISDVEGKQAVGPARVQLLLGGEGDASRSLVATAVTGADGAFRVDGLPAGPVQFVTVASPTFGAVGAVPSPAVAAREGEPVRMSLAMHRGRSIAGKLRASMSGGEALAGVEILAWTRAAGFVAETKSGADGTWRISGLPWVDPGASEPEAVLVVAAPGWTAEAREVEVRAPGRAGDVLHGTFGLLRASAIAGRVVDDAGAPVGDAWVTLAIDGTRHALGIPWRYAVRSGADGTFLAPELWPEKYRVTATSRKVAGKAEAVVRAEEPGKTTSGIELRLGASGGPSPK